MRYLARSFAVLAALTIPTGGASAQSERIHEFHSLIQVGVDGTLDVTETITVTATGAEIKRGIYRDFPTTFAGPDGRHHTVGFRVTEVLRDGKPEPWKMASVSGGMRVYIGSKAKRLSPGKYTYTITYWTDRQIGFFDDYDELYWNVTGNDWEFPIDSVSAVVILPDGAPVQRKTAYTGFHGSRGRDWQSTYDDAGRQIFETTRLLSRGEGFTIVVAWPKGFVASPTAADALRWWFRDNIYWIIAATAFGGVLIYFLVVWYRVGRDPAVGTIIPRFDPPEGISPAAARYIIRMEYDSKAAAAAAVNLAAQGYLSIKRGGDGAYELVKRKSDNSLPGARTARAFYKALFEDSETVTLDPAGSREIKLAVGDLKLVLSGGFSDIYFARNTSRRVVGAFASVFAAICLIFVVIVEEAVSSGFLLISGAAALLLLLNVVFAKLLPARTRKGQHVLDHLNGFRMYLVTAEKNRLNLLHPPEQTPELFERYLPYAMALDVENEWGEQFRDILNAASTRGDQGYLPEWYRTEGDFTLGDFTHDLGHSLSRSVHDSAAQPPASTSDSSLGARTGFSEFGGGSSGFGGGGFSGGGGGGGGGGGW